MSVAGRFETRRKLWGRLPRLPRRPCKCPFARDQSCNRLHRRNYRTIVVLKLRGLDTKKTRFFFAMFFYNFYFSYHVCAVASQFLPSCLCRHVIVIARSYAIHADAVFAGFLLSCAVFTNIRTTVGSRS